MKENKRLQKIQQEDYHSENFLWLLIFFFLLPFALRAQCLPQNLPLNYGERITYDAYFKWGILMPKAGEAVLSFSQTRYAGQDASRYRLTFRTTGIFESIYRMRDTLSCYFSAENKLLFGNKRADEHDDALLHDDLTFSYRNNKTYVRSHRYTSERVKIDTVLVGDGCVFDMLGSIFYLRVIDWEQLSVGDIFPLQVAIGRDMVRMRIRYLGQEIVAQGQRVKYKTLRFSLDIYDDVFSVSKSAAEIWVGDDRNHLPVKIRAKLKIGAAEINYKTSKGLKYPLDCRVVMPNR